MFQHNPDEARIQTLHTIAAELWQRRASASSEYEALPEIDQENEPGEALSAKIELLDNAHNCIEQAIDYLSRLQEA